MIVALLGWALAQEAVPSEAPSPEPPPEEITVWGEGAIRQARSTVVRSFEAQGWTHRKDRDGVAVFRGPAAWMGKAYLHYDGTLTFRRPVLSVQTVQAELPEPATPSDPYFPRDPGGLAYPADGGVQYALPHPSGTFWLLPSWDVVGPAHQRLRDAAATELEAYRAVLDETRRRGG